MGECNQPVMLECICSYTCGPQGGCQPGQRLFCLFLCTLYGSQFVSGADIRLWDTNRRGTGAGMQAPWLETLRMRMLATGCRTLCNGTQALQTKHSLGFLGTCRTPSIASP